MGLTAVRCAFSNHFVERHRVFLLRGGRLTKVSSQAASYAPDVGVSNTRSRQPPILERAAGVFASSVSARALAIVMMATTPVALTVTGAQAGVCTETFAGSGIFVCSGAAGADVTQSLAPPATGTLDVSTLPGFGITTAAGDAIDLSNVAGDTNITFTDNNTSAITGNANGIFADNNGGSLTINALGTTIGLANNGIYVSNNVGASNLSITANIVTGNASGILAGNFGTGSNSVTTTGAVTGTTGRGIYAYNSAAGTSLTINTQGAVSGGVFGIEASNLGTAGLTITAGGDVTGTTGYGINAFNSANDVTASMVINQTAGTITTGTAGIVADNSGGSLTINALGTTNGTIGYGIAATNRTGTTNLTITANNINSLFGGVRAVNLGTGAVVVTTTGTLNSTFRYGITASNSANGTDLSIVAQGNIYAYYSAIRALNLGSGSTSIITSGIVTSASGSVRDGIYVGTAATATSLSVTTGAGAVTGDTDGIDARNLGTAGLTITVGGDVTGRTRQGINAYNSANDVTASMVINQAAGTITTGALNGIFADNFGGSLTINALGTTVGLASNGINAFNQVGTTDFTITANTVTGAANGIYARNFGTGSTSVTTTGAVTGTGNSGIFVRNSATGTSLTVDAQGAVSGGIYGIAAINSGSGALSVTTQAVTGTATDGIFALNNAAGTSLAIDAQGAVSGADNGIRARNYGSGALSITTNAVVTGGTGYGIRTTTGAGDTTVITLNSGAAVSSTAGLGIFNDAGDSNITVNTGAAVNGTISLGDGSDNLNFSGGDFSGVSLFDGGDDSAVADTFIDTLTFAGSGGALTGATVANWENVVIGAGSTISFSDNALSAGRLAINARGILNATGGALVLTADVSNSGTINAQDGAANDTVTVTGNYTGTGSLLIDVDFTADVADTLVINGNVTGGATTVTLNDVSSGTISGNDILVVDVTGTSSAEDFVLDTPNIGAFFYNLAQVGSDFFLQQAGFNTAMPTFESLPQILLKLNTLATLRQRRPNLYGIGSNSAGIQPAGGNASNKQSGPLWARFEGTRSDIEANTSTTGSSYDLDQWKIRVGIDGLIQKNDTGLWLFGVNGYYGMANADISSATGNGSIDTKGFGLGLTTTWYGNEGYYVDGQAQFSWFSNDLSDVTNGTLVTNNDGTGYAFGLEAGKRFAMNNGWTLTPQAQLVYSSVDFDRFSGGGAAVSLEDGDSLKGRIGINIDQKRTWTEADGSTGNSQIYGLANLYYEFSGKSQVNVSGIKFTNRPDRLSGEIGAGASYNWDDNKYSLYGEISTATSLENFGESYQLKGTAGIRVKF